MQIEDDAIILSAKKFNERDMVITAFCRENGIYSGIAKYAQGKAKLPIFQQGNIIDFIWRARLEEQLGTLTAELQTAIAAQTMHDRAKLKAVFSITSLIKTSLAERDAHPRLYDVVKDLLLLLAGEGDWLEEYVKFEIELLRECGFGMDFSKCAATGSLENLKYISPKTGRAVSEEGAVGYESKLLKIPEHDDYKAWLKITGYFLAKHIYIESKFGIPEERESFVTMLDKDARS